MRRSKWHYYVGEQTPFEGLRLELGKEEPMTIDVIVPVRRLHTLERLLYSFSRNTVAPDVISLVSNEIDPINVPTFGLNIRLVEFSSDDYPVGHLDAALRRNIGIWTSKCSHVITFDDDQLAPVDTVAASIKAFRERAFFWGHHRFLDFSRHTVDEMMNLPPDAGRPREMPVNAWHSWRSSYAGLFGAKRELVLRVGGFDMIFSGRHAGEDQDLGRRLAAFVDNADSIYVQEPPFAWHPEHNTHWDEPRYSNVCVGEHDLELGVLQGIAAHVCKRCPFYWVPDSGIVRTEVGLRFDPNKVRIRERSEGMNNRASLFQALRVKMREFSLEAAIARLQQPYEEYTTSVSPPQFAISLRTAAFLRVLCQALAPASILDFGSGFSSYVFRAPLAQGPGSVVWTVDDDPYWLERTRSFLKGHGLDTEHLVHWDDLQKLPPPPVDLVLHDLGSMSTRLRTLPAALNLCRVGGLVVLDDMHKEEYAPHAEKILASSSCSWLDVRSHTMDNFGRFSWVATRGVFQL